jgi:predicted negative regulator of RcsB-dependent stress response
MGDFSDIGNDFMKMIATLGAIAAVVIIFLAWSSIGILAVIILVVLAAAGFIGWKMFQNR